jgi:hypothetical protein
MREDRKKENEQERKGGKNKLDEENNRRVRVNKFESQRHTEVLKGKKKR